MRGVSRQIRQAYEFLVSAYSEGRAFTYDELHEASGWSLQTMRANWSKKLKGFVEKSDGKWRARSMVGVTLDAFARTCSQSAARSADPLRPELPVAVEGRIVKARDAALAAVQHYNNPTASFRSDNYVMLMVVAFTALFHAMCERDGVDYRAYDGKGTVKLTGAGDPWLWDVTACTKHYAAALSPSVQKNLEFVLGLRHRIEHRYVPQLDVQVASECQALLLNFEQLLTSQFGDYYALGTALSIALQVSSTRPRETAPALRVAEAAAFDEVSRWVSEFRNALPDEVFADPGYALRVWLVPKPANEARRSDKVVDYVDMRECDDETRSALSSAIVAIKTKIEKKYVVADDTWLWEKDLTIALQQKLGADVTWDNGVRKLRSGIVRDLLKAGKIRDFPELCDVQHKPGARPCYNPILVDHIAAAYKKDGDIFYKAHSGGAVDLNP